jgi:hypothetical protein
MTATGRWFIAILWVSGLLSGIGIAKAPGLFPLPSPHLSVPLIVSLLIDLALQPLARSGRIPPLTMNQRAIAVIGAGVISLGVAALLGS